MSKGVTRQNWKKWIKYLPFVLIVLLAVYFAVIFDLDEFKAFIARHERFSLAICLVTYVFLGLTLIPSEPVTILVLAWKGPFVAILLAMVGNTLAAMVEFYIGGGIGDITDFEKKKAKLPFHLDRIPINSPLFMLLGRMIPGFGPKFVSIMGGVYKVPMLTYLWTALLANLLGAGVIVAGGVGILAILK